jgi:hypothetical protein
MTESPFPDRDGRVFFDLARDRLNEQLETLDAIDSKIALLFSTSTTLVGILAAVLALRPGSFDTVSYILVGVSMLCYGVASWHAWRGYRARVWKYGPNLTEVWRALTDEGGLTDHQIEWSVANDIRLAYVENSAKVKAKADALDAIARALLTQTVILVLALVVASA